MTDSAAVSYTHLSNVFNMVTKRGLAMEDAEIRWIDCNIGSGLTMKYPAVDVYKRQYIHSVGFIKKTVIFYSSH